MGGGEGRREKGRGEKEKLERLREGKERTKQRERAC